MAYIYLDELKEILPDILDQWIDKDDESWEWIFQEIEQKCHVGKRLKGKKWQKKIMEDIDKLYARSNVDNADIGMLAAELKRLETSVTALRHDLEDDIKAAKSMAQTAKQRTEVDYSKYSGKSDGKISYSNPEAKKLNEELNNMSTDDIAQWCKEQDSKNLQSCTTCKHYCGNGTIKAICIDCNNFEKREAKENG